MEERAAGLPISLSIKKEWEYCKRAIRAIAVLISQNLMANMMHLMFQRVLAEEAQVPHQSKVKVTGEVLFGSRREYYQCFHARYLQMERHQLIQVEQEEGPEAQ